jgi:hypothetical protein
MQIRFTIQVRRSGCKGDIMTAASIESKPARKLTYSRVLLAGAMAIVMSIIANLLIRWLGMLVLPVDSSFMPLADTVPTIMFTTIFLVLATIVFLVINAFTADPPRVFTIVATVALVLSLIPDAMFLINPAAMPIGTPTVGAVIILILQHIAAYLITLWAFTRWAPQA